MASTTPSATLADIRHTVSTSSKATKASLGDGISSQTNGTTSGTIPGNVTTKYDYDEVLRLSNLFYQAQRSGELDAYGDFNHNLIPYRGDSSLQDGSDNGVDLTGGYHDGKSILEFFCN